MRPRLLAISPHPDDETFFMGGTLARYSAEADVRLVVVGDGENGKMAVGADGWPRTPAAHEREAFVAARRRQCRAAARALGIGAVEFLGFRDWAFPAFLVAALRLRVSEFDPHVVVSLSEAGTTAHADHSRTAMATFQALRSMLRRAYGDRAAGGQLPFAPPFSLRRYLTFTLPLAAKRFDYWGELAVPAEHLTRIDVRDRIGVKRRAARLHLSQAHWVDYLERVGVLGLPYECFLERLCIGESARGGRDLLAGIERRSLRLSLSEMPLAADAYTSSNPGLHAELVHLGEAAARQSMKTVILASGYGLRMGNPGTPKSLEPVNQRPLIRYIVEAVRAAGVDDRPIVVVGPGGDRIRDTLGWAHVYAEQGEPLGTGHALGCCREALADAEARHVLVLYGDKPVISAETVRSLTLRHLQEGSVITMGTVKLADFDGWRRHLRQAGRIVRSADGRVSRIVESVDATEGERAITEINAGVFCFRTEWLWRHLHRLGRDNRKGEYYLTDLVELAAREQAPVATVDVRPEEGVGVNTREDLALAASLLLPQRLDGRKDQPGRAGRRPRERVARPVEPGRANPASARATRTG